MKETRGRGSSPLPLNTGSSSGYSHADARSLSTDEVPGSPVPGARNKSIEYRNSKSRFFPLVSEYTFTGVVGLVV